MPRKPTRARQLGVTDAEYERLLAAQGGHCALCPATPKTEHSRTRAWKCRYCHRVNRPSDPACTKCERARPKPSRFHVDHDHETGRVRGLLCWKCNDALPTWVTRAWLWNAVVYLDDEALDAGTFTLYARGDV